MSFAPETETLAKPEVLLRVPVGLSSPLWGFFAGAAVSGATWWWMTRWMRPGNLEAMFGAAAKADGALEYEFASLTAPVADALAEGEPVAIAEAVVEAVVEAAPELAGAAAAPISPSLETFAPEIVEPEFVGSQVEEAEVATVAFADTVEPEVAAEATQFEATAETLTDAVAEMAPKSKKATTPKLA
jgi:hypothetical protein